MNVFKQMATVALLLAPRSERSMTQFMRGVVAGLFALIGLSLSAIASATPTYYTFASTQLRHDVGNPELMPSPSIGLTYVFLVNRDQNGSETLQDNSVVEFTDQVNSDSMEIDSNDFFYVDLISGHYLPVNVNSVPYYKELNVGQDFLRTSISGDPLVRSIRFEGGPSDAYTIVEQAKFGQAELDMSIGSQWQIFETGVAPDGSSVWAMLYVQLTGILTVNPIPEPTTIRLLIIGLGLLSFTRRKKQNS